MKSINLYFRFTILSIVLVAQLLSGVHLNVLAETTNQNEEIIDSTSTSQTTTTEDTTQTSTTQTTTSSTIQIDTSQVQTTTEATIKIVGLDTNNSFEQIVQFDKNATALSILDSVADIEIVDSAYGPYINGINGVQSEGTYFWSFYINGVEAQVGAASYKPAENDILAFKYVSWEEATNKATIKITGDNASETKLSFDEDATALSFLKAVADVEIVDSAYGPYINGINGVQAAGTYYWAFYINEQPAQEGAGSYTPQPDDILEFKYESWEQQQPSEQPVEEPGVSLPAGDLTAQIEETAQWIQNKGIESTWEALALRQLGKAIPQAYFQSIEDRIVEKDGQFDKVTDYELDTIGLTVGSKDPTDIQGFNLVESIYNNENMTVQGTNGVIYALLALDSNQYEIPNGASWNRDRLVQFLIDSQLSDGGWALTGTVSDIDITAMALSALAPYKDQENVDTAIDKAINWLSGKQLSNGGFSGKYGENLETTATVLTALSSLAIDPKQASFIKENGNIVDYIASYILADGSFKHQKADDSSSSFATEQGLIALVSYARYLDGKGTIFNLSNLPPVEEGTGGTNPGTGQAPIPVEQKTQTVYVTVKTHEATIYSTKAIEVKEGATAYSALVDAIGNGRIETSGSGSSIYVSGIDGVREFDDGPTSGWKFSVNGYYPQTGAGQYPLSNGDRLIWIYVVEDQEASDYKSTVGNNQDFSKPENVSEEIHQSLEAIKQNTKEMNVVLNKNEKMTKENAQKLREQLNENVVKLEKTVNPSEETVISSPNNEEAKIVIPKQALKQQETIKIEELNLSSEEHVKSSIYEFLPNGTKFEKPVYISMQVPIEDEALENLVMAWLNEETNKWEPIPTVMDAKTGILTGKVDHFTKFAVIDTSKLDANLDISSELNSLIRYLQEDDTQSEWEDFGLARSGKINQTAALTTLRDKINEVNGYFRKITDYERFILTIQALGGNPSNFNQYNLIEKVYNNERMTLQGTNGLIFALLALDGGDNEIPASAKWKRAQIIDEILASQNNDGGFTLVKGEASDVDITAMALAALANYKDQPEVKAAIDQAINWLSSVQQTSGGFIADGNENSESVSQVLIALTSLGMNPQDELFAKANGNVVSNLLSYQNKDGGFSNIKGQSSNQIASEQALLALTALDRFNNELPSLYNLTDQGINTVEVLSSQPIYVDDEKISPYAIASVYQAYQYGLMRGVDKKELRFAPQQYLTRAQFTAVLMKLLGEKSYLEDNIIFDDVKPNQWYYQPVMKAQQLGIVYGISKTSFAPNEPITREQAAIIIARAYQLSPDKGRNIYHDISSQATDLKAAAQVLYDYGIIKGYQGNLFNPKNKVTREMGAVIAVRIHDKLNN